MKPASISMYRLIILCTTVFCFNALQLRAQNNAIFGFGNGSGYHQTTFAQQGGNSSNVFGFGDASGSSFNNYSQLSPWFDIFGFGNGSGATSENYSQFSSALNIFGFGPSSGSITACFQQNSLNEGNIFGFGSAAGNHVMCYESQQPFLSFFGFGIGSGATTQCFQQSQLFSGNNNNIYGYGVGAGYQQSCQQLFSPLPIRLLNFNAMPLIDNQSAFIEWNTAASSNLNRFILYRSFDGKQWDKITEAAAINSMNVVSYTYTDKIFKLNHKRPIYYQLQSVEQDGLINDHGIRSVIFGEENHQIVYTNPFSNQLDLVIKGALVEDNFDVLIYDLAGKLLMKQAHTGNTFAIKTDHLAAGCYILTLYEKGGNLLGNFKVIKY